MVPGTDEGILPEVRFREHRLALYVVKKGAKPFIEVAEGKITLDEFMSQLSDDDLIELLWRAAKYRCGQYLWFR